MHHKTKEAAIAKMKKADPNISEEAIAATLELMENMAGALPAVATAPSEQIIPKAPMIKADMWRGTLMMIKDKSIPQTGQRQITKMQFQYIDAKPKRSGIVTTQDRLDDWNQSHFSARMQVTDMLLPAGQKLDMIFTLNEDSEKWEISTRKLETA